MASIWWRGPGAPSRVRVYPVDLRKRPFEDVISAERPDAIVHLGFVHHFELSARRRHESSRRGTQRLLQHCTRYGVSQRVVLSSGYVYGAHPENPFHLSEVASPSADLRDPELRDLGRSTRSRRHSCGGPRSWQPACCAR